MGGLSISSRPSAREVSSTAEAAPSQRATPRVDPRRGRLRGPGRLAPLVPRKQGLPRRRWFRVSWAWHPATARARSGIRIPRIGDTGADGDGRELRVGQSGSPERRRAGLFGDGSAGGAGAAATAASPVVSGTAATRQVLTATVRTPAGRAARQNGERRPLLIGHGGREVLSDGAPPGATEHPKPRLSCKNAARSGSNKGLRWRSGTSKPWQGWESLLYLCSRRERTQARRNPGPKIVGRYE